MKSNASKSTDNENKLITDLILQINRNEEEKYLKPHLWGWDDGRIFFANEGKEHCVNDHAELFNTLMHICKEYYKFKERKEVEREIVFENNKQRKRVTK